MQLNDMIDENGHCEIPDGTTAVPIKAFAYCARLKSVRIPDSVTYISAYAFRDCTALKSVRIPDSVAAIGEWAFDSCTALPSALLARHTAILVSGDWLQIGCQCARLGWWELGKGREFATRNGYTEAEYATAIEQLRQLVHST